MRSPPPRRRPPPADREPRAETGISPIHGHAPSIAAALDAAPFFDVDDPAEARTLVRDLTKHIAQGWREALRRQGITGAALRACAPAFEHDRLEEALAS